MRTVFGAVGKFTVAQITTICYYFSVNNNYLFRRDMYFKRKLRLNEIKSSAFLFGPRLTGKTTLLSEVECDAFFNLLDPELELEYKAHPRLFWEQIKALAPKSLIFIDEIQKIPSLLNYVQMGMEQLKHRFILSGSSARKLKRGGANLLGGRSLSLKLHPLTFEEIRKDFSIELVLRFGTIPKIYSLVLEKQTSLAKEHLKSYVTTYIKEEIQAEALTRNIGAFQRFLSIAAQSNAQIIEFSNISRDCSVAASTVKEYFQILEDTLIGFFLWPYHRNERKKARAKFYFFDTGVVRAIQNRIQDPPTLFERGFLFESWFIAELMRIRDYYGKEHQFSFWRKRDHEIDIIISNSRRIVLAIECKSGKNFTSKASIKAFQSEFPKVPLMIASLVDVRPRKIDQLEILPFQTVIKKYLELK